MLISLITFNFVFYICINHNKEHRRLSLLILLWLSSSSSLSLSLIWCCWLYLLLLLLLLLLLCLCDVLCVFLCHHHHPIKIRARSPRYLWWCGGVCCGASRDWTSCVCVQNQTVNMQWSSQRQRALACVYRIDKRDTSVVFNLYIDRVYMYAWFHYVTFFIPTISTTHSPCLPFRVILHSG